MANETKINDAFIQDTNNLLEYLNGLANIKVEKINFIQALEQFENYDEILKEMTNYLKKCKKTKYIHQDIISTYIDLANKSKGLNDEYHICGKCIELSDTPNLLLYLQQLWIKVMAKEKIQLAEAVKNFENFEMIHERVKTLIQTSKKSRAKYIDNQCLANYIDLVNQSIGIKSKYILMANRD